MTVRLWAPIAALPLAAFEFGGERVEVLVPEPAVSLDPHVDLPQGFRVDRVQPPGAVGPDRGEAVVP